MKTRTYYLIAYKHTEYSNWHVIDKIFQTKEGAEISTQNIIGEAPNQNFCAKLIEVEL